MRSQHGSSSPALPGLVLLCTRDSRGAGAAGQAPREGARVPPCLRAASVGRGRNSAGRALARRLKGLRAPVVGLLRSGSCSQ